MATRKVTITIDEEQLAAIQALVAADKADSVSGFVKHAVAVSLSDVTSWSAMLGLALEETGGSLTRQERAWADAILRPPTKSKRKRHAA